MLLACVYLGLVLIPHLARGEGLWREYPDNLILDGLARWDSGWYLRIARYGYLDAAGGSQRDTAFFPAYPLVLSLANLLSQKALAGWGIIVSNTFFLAGLCLTYDLVKTFKSRRLARRVIALMAFSPASVFFSAVYTESMFFVFSTAAFRLAQKRKPYSAMLCAAIASLTRVVGFACVPFTYWLYKESSLREQASQIGRAHV